MPGLAIVLEPGWLGEDAVENCDGVETRTVVCPEFRMVYSSRWKTSLGLAIAVEPGWLREDVEGEVVSLTGF